MITKKCMFCDKNFFFNNNHGLCGKCWHGVIHNICLLKDDQELEGSQEQRALSRRIFEKNYEKLRNQTDES